MVLAIETGGRWSARRLHTPCNSWRMPKCSRGTLDQNVAQSPSPRLLLSQRETPLGVERTGNGPFLLTCLTVIPSGCCVPL